jgi:hypothetical protein
MMKERIMAILIGVIMLGSMATYALIQKTPRDTAPVEFPIFMERPLQPEERVEILRRGVSLIEFLYPGNCTDCTAKAEMYKSFVTSEDFKGYIVLSSAQTENDTADWIIGMNGDRTSLEDVNTSADLEKEFCKVAMSQPTRCMLQEI